MDEIRSRKDFFEILSSIRVKQGINRNQVSIMTGINNPAAIKVIEEGGRNSAMNLVLNWIRVLGGQLIVNDQVINEEFQLRETFRVMREQADDEKLRTFYGVGKASGVDWRVVQRCEKGTITIDTFLALLNFYQAKIRIETKSQKIVYFVYKKNDGSIYLSESELVDPTFISKRDRIEAVFEITGTRLSNDLSPSEVKKYISANIYGTSLWRQYQDALLKQNKLSCKVEVTYPFTIIVNDVIQLIKNVIVSADFENSGFCEIKMVQDLGTIAIQKIRL